jgi:methylthioribose-1-phosphate isomerase
MDIRTIDYAKDAIRIIDQTKLPLELKFIDIRDIKTLWRAIRLLKVRGAPALGAAAALGAYLGIRDSKAKDFATFSRELDKVTKYLATSRPTARNLFWGLERMCSVAVRNKEKTISQIKKLLLLEAERIISSDREICRKIGYYGAKLVKDGANILTICNAGILATIDYGTALGVIYRAKEEGKRIKVFSSETRPLLQGARLTSWELKENGIDVTVISDSTAGLLMRNKNIDLVIAGADRIAANGDAANKVGTYGLAVLSKFHGIPFYIAAPVSTFDLSITSGSKITVEERNPDEIRTLLFKKQVALKNADIYNPAFDVTPHGLISAIITEYGVITSPYLKNIRKALHETK